MLKIQRDLAGNKNPYIQVIAEHLISSSETDELIRKTLDKKNKSLEEMFEYVTGEAKKEAVKNVAMIARDAVFGWAQHYYDEDSISFKKKTKGKKVKPKKVLKLPKEVEDAFDF